jgi:serine/threonine protein kinase
VIIDFGTVRDLIKGTIQGDTIAGTFGYMVPEQFMGKALVQSDIYAVGVVAVIMLSRLPPNELIA